MATMRGISGAVVSFPDSEPEPHLWLAAEDEIEAGGGETQHAHFPVTTCTTRPTFTPAIGTATVPGDNQIRVTWTAAVPTPGAYAIERAEGVCGSEGLSRPLTATVGTF